MLAYPGVHAQRPISEHFSHILSQDLLNSQATLMVIISYITVIFVYKLFMSYIIFCPTVKNGMERNI